jgi:hypothetical protein
MATATLGELEYHRAQLAVGRDHDRLHLRNLLLRGAGSKAAAPADNDLAPISRSRHAATGSPRYAHALNLPGPRFWPLTRYPHLVLEDHTDVWRVWHGERDIP